jgi:hypothetical protein
VPELLSAHREAAQPLGLLIVYLDVLDLRAAGALAGEVDHPGHRLRVALEDGLDRPVGAIAHPARNALALGLPAHGVAEEDALDSSSSHDALSDRVTLAHARSFASPGAFVKCAAASAGDRAVETFIEGFGPS